MLGKRPRQMRRTVSISMLGSGSTMSEILTPPEYPKDKQKPHLEVPACYTQRQVVLSDNFPVSEPGKAQTEIGACYAAPVLPFSHSGSRPRERKETGAVGLSIVAALHADKKIEVKDYREKAISALVSYRPVYQHNLLPSAQPSLACHVPHKQMQPQAMQMQAPSSSHRKSSSASHKNQNFVVPPAMHFLEACCYCRRRLSQGRDIYMYRGDKAFCSEQCRDQQILIDERKDKCFLTALRMRLAAEPSHSSSQRSRALVTSTAAG